MLPEEILTLVSRHLIPDYKFNGPRDREQCRALYDMCLVSKVWHRATIPALYRTIDFRYHDIENTIRSFITQPKRSVHVKRILFHAHQPLPCASLIWTIEVLEQLDIPTECRDLVLDGFRLGDLNTKYAFFLCLCRMLEYVSCTDDSSLLKIFTAIGNPSRYCLLSRLSTLDIIHQHWGLDRLLYYASRLPSLKTLICRSGIGPFDIWQLPVCLFSSMNHLNLQVSVGSTGLSPLLLAFPNLESCNLELYRSTSQRTNLDTLGFASIAPFLRTRGTNLRHLHIRFARYNSFDHSNLFGESLEFLTTLETLSVPSQFLFPRLSDADAERYDRREHKTGPYSIDHLANFLPSSLKRLHVRCTKKETATNATLHIRQIGALVLSRHCPALEKVFILGIKKRFCSPTISEVTQQLSETTWESFIEDNGNWRLFQDWLPDKEVGFLWRHKDYCYK